jgi:sugar lactone lactonase YvrE
LIKSCHTLWIDKIIFSQGLIMRSLSNSPFMLALLAATALGVTSLGGCAGGAGPEAQSLTTVAEMDANPGNSAIAPSGRLFSTIHAFRPAPVRLVEVLGIDEIRPFPNNSWNDATRPANERLISPLGLTVDSRNRLWVIDNGHDADGQKYSPKLLAFNLADGSLAYRQILPPHIAAPGSFPQDLVVDAERGFAYIADVGLVAPPAIIAVNLSRKTAHRMEGLAAFMPEDEDMIVDGRVLKTGGQPARVGLNPITLSADGTTLYFGSMNGTRWYSVPAERLHSSVHPSEMEKHIKLVGRKPVSDGAATDAKGNHYFTDVNNNAISILPKGASRSHVLVQDARLSWPDSISIAPDGDLIIAVNQLHRTPFFNNGVDAGDPPYRIMRLELGQP